MIGAYKSCIIIVPVVGVLEQLKDLVTLVTNTLDCILKFKSVKKGILSSGIVEGSNSVGSFALRFVRLLGATVSCEKLKYNL